MIVDVHIAHLESVIRFLKISISAALRGYEQAVEEMGRAGDMQGKDWSEAYEFMKRRLEQLKANMK